VADDVPDHQHRRAVGLEERVVPVAADLRSVRGRAVPHGDLQVVGFRRRGQQRLLQPVGQRALLGGPLGHPPQLRRLAPGGQPVGQVAEGDHHAGHRAVLHRRDGDQLDRHGGAVAVPEDLVLGGDRPAAPQRVPDRALVLRVRRAVGPAPVDHRVLVAPELLLGGEPGHPHRRRVDELDAPVGVQAVDAVGDVGQHALVPGEGPGEQGLHVGAERAAPIVAEHPHDSVTSLASGPLRSTSLPYQDRLSPGGRRPAPRPRAHVPTDGDGGRGGQRRPRERRHRGRVAPGGGQVRAPGAR
jgi:hypothetical protein